MTRLICLPLARNCSSAVNAAAAAALSLADCAGGVVVSAYQKKDQWNGIKEV